ncbi:hypothetical protein P8452_51895 [Trifolium repens]|nr:hypothetical protein P8452_51895 [Trifolium repens]
MQLSNDKVENLTAIFTLEEITEVVMSCDGTKSPGPDGFNFAFVKEFWDLLKFDVQIMFDQFYGNECLPKSLCSYFLTLIPKVSSPQTLGDFRPISLIGCLYKLVAKVLAARLAKVIGELIPHTQSAFIKGRQLVDGVVVVNEVIDYAKKSGKECVIFKVDFEKVYDSVDLGFLEYMLRRFGFGDKWCAWMKVCVCAGNMSVLVNGCATEEISIKRGLKQGDPLSPLLFLIVAEGLGSLMRMAVDRGRFQPFKVGRGGVPVSILQYADDTLCIGEASVTNLWVIKAVLRGFELTSGLKVNFWKSCLFGVNVSNEFLTMTSEFLNCRLGVLPFKYLGLPVGANPRLCSTWKPMLDTIKGRLGAWGNKYVSLGGRIVLINAVLNSLPIFFLSYFKMPVKVWQEVVKIQRKFFWGGIGSRRKICRVKWSEICKPKKEGGLGIKDLRLMNISLLAKWRWKLLKRDDELWKKVVVAKYGNNVIGGVTLQSRFPRLFGVSSQQDKLVCEVGSSLESFVFKFIWKSGVPSKVSALSWQVLLDRVPTRDNLRSRGIITAVDARCPLCNDDVETATHLFLQCRYATGIWFAILRWLGVFSVLPPSLAMSYALLVGYGTNKKRRKGFSVVWLAYVWAVWKARNDRVFNNIAFDASVVMDNIKRLSWNWFMHSTAKRPCLLYEWEWEPGDCMIY